MGGRVRVGISGWRYPAWRGDFYPKGLAQRRELAYAASRLTSIEINGSFYSLQRPTSYAAWRADATAARADFVFALKGPRYVTHLKRLKDVEVPLANFFASGVLALGPALGPILWQLPETLRFDAAVLDDFLGRLPRTTSEAADLASRHDDKVPDDRALTTAEGDDVCTTPWSSAARRSRHPRRPTYSAGTASPRCYADTAGRWPRVDQDTGPVRYVRLHGDQELYASGYTERALDEWAERCRGWADGGQDVFVYFDNDMKGYAPRDAMRLIERLGKG